MTLSVVTAGGGDWEAALVAGLAGGELGARVVRRCVDLADVLAVAAAGTADVALVGLSLRGLDRAALDRLAACGVPAVGVLDGVAADDRRARLGLAWWVAAGTPAAEVAAVLARAAGGVDPIAGPARPVPAGPGGSAPEPRRTGVAAPHPEPPAHDGAPNGAAHRGAAPGADRPGRVLAVWGPTGAPGRTTVALGLAAESAALGLPTLLCDGDVYGGVVAQLLGVLDDTAGILAAARSATAGTLDPPALAGLARSVAPGLRVLTGLSRADRWPELRPAAVPAVLDCARRLVGLTVVDCGFALEEDEELAYDTLAPRRNGATLAVLAEADLVVVVGSADPVGLQRLVRGLAELRERLPAVSPLVVLNRVRRSVAGAGSERAAAEAVERFTGLVPLAALPADVAALDAAAAAGRTLAEVAPGAPLRMALADLAARLTGGSRGARGRFRRGRRALP